MEKPSSKHGKRPNPRKGANILSQLTFAYILPTFVKGFKKNLEEDDMTEHLEEHSSSVLGDRLEIEWKRELLRQKPSLWRALRKVFGLELFFLGIAYAINQLLVKISQPLALAQLMKYYSQTDGALSRRNAFLCAGFIVATSIINVFLTHNYMLSLQHLGMKLRVACCSLIYRKSLRLNKNIIGGTTIGQMINLLSNDVNRCDRAVLHIHTLWVCPVQTILIIIILHNLLGFISTVGVFAMVTFVPFQMYLAKMTSAYRMKTALKTDERIKMMNEIISGIQVIKTYTWEKPFAKLVDAVRRLEIRNVRVTSYIKSVMTAVLIFITRFSIFITILSYVLTGNHLTAEYVFVVTSFYNILKQIMTKNFSSGITELAELSVSVFRLQKFLFYQETKERSKTVQDGAGVRRSNYVIRKNKLNFDEKTGVRLREVSAKWRADSSLTTLKEINFKARLRQCVTLVGPVGCGKTSLLHVILKELPLESGMMDVRGVLSYATQEPWLFAGSVQQNILFGESLDIDRYRQVLEVCALEQDLKLLPYGDRTLVGEKGVMLSGGQRARINLARAVYKKADIYLLDDPLSAVDTRVGKRLFEECILKFLKDKCTILVTHQLQYLSDVDHIYVVDGGKITINGTYQEIKESQLFFVKLLGETKKTEVDGRTNRARAQSTQEEEEKETKPIPVKEQKQSGTISRDVYLSYFDAGGSWLIAIFILLVFVVVQISGSAADYFLTIWVNNEHNDEQRKNFTTLSREFCIYTYSIIVGFMIVLTITGTFCFYKYCTRASIKLHDMMFSNIIYAPMKFFNDNPSGRILNRFSKDIGSVDEILPTIALDCLEIGLGILGVTLVVSLVKPWLFIISIIVFVIFYLLRVVYLATSLNLKRLEGVTRSPVFDHIGMSLQGLTTIRAYRAQNILKKEFDDLQNKHSSVWFLFLSCTKAFAFWLDMSCLIYITVVTFSFFMSTADELSGNVGLAITQAISLTGRLQWGMRQWSEMENQMTSMERVVEYTKVDREIERTEITPCPKWPNDGKIHFRSVSLRYSSNDPYILKRLTFTINPNEKIGIVGRTGAGKSSLIYALFQLAEIEGCILIDDVDITKISLNRLRSAISIIPQEPVLFSGTLRSNLDPFVEYPDVDLWDALDEVELKQVVAQFPLGLSTKMSDGGSNFSVGQRQLLCMARALVRKNKILVLDEATANVDHQTDKLIQLTIRKKFVDCTVLTIAHRLHTIMDSDKVLVMDSGNTLEFDHPYLLLQNRNSTFYGMVQYTGQKMSETLLKYATKNYLEKNRDKV